MHAIHLNNKVDVLLNLAAWEKWMGKGMRKLEGSVEKKYCELNGSTEKLEF